jgi:hypothetical protein
MSETYYTKEVLVKALKEAGLSCSYQWILKMEKLGRLTCPRSPVSGWRQFTQEQIDEIVKAFSPRGSGKYLCEPVKTIEEYKPSKIEEDEIYSKPSETFFQ